MNEPEPVELPAGASAPSTSVPEAPGCTKLKCEHWESESPAFYGHCSHSLCRNYMEGCPVHESPRKGNR